MNSFRIAFVESKKVKQTTDVVSNHSKSVQKVHYGYFKIHFIGITLYLDILKYAAADVKISVHTFGKQISICTSCISRSIYWIHYP